MKSSWSPSWWSPRGSKWPRLLLVLLQGFNGSSFGSRDTKSLFLSSWIPVALRVFELTGTFLDFNIANQIRSLATVYIMALHVHLHKDKQSVVTALLVFIFFCWPVNLKRVTSGGSSLKLQAASLTFQAWGFILTCWVKLYVCLPFVSISLVPLNSLSCRFVWC